jgi:hypothetical protein
MSSRGFIALDRNFDIDVEIIDYGEIWQREHRIEGRGL